MGIKVNVPAKRKPIEEEYEEDEEETEEDEEEESEEQNEEPQKTSFAKKVERKDNKERRGGDSETVEIEMGDGSFRRATKVWANDKESAISTDSLLILVAKKLFAEMDKE